MTVIRYEAKTKSGSVYLVEDHTHLIGSSTWYIYRQNKPLRLHILIPTNYPIPKIAEEWAKGTNLPEGYLKEKAYIILESGFIGRMMVYSNNHDPNRSSKRYISTPVVEFRKME
jgi:hypothetical protein